MESAKPKPLISMSGKSRGHIEDIGIDFLQPQQYYYDAVKSHSRSPRDFKALMARKSAPLQSKDDKSPTVDTAPNIGNSSERCNVHPETKQSSREGVKASDESLTKKRSKKTAKILKKTAQILKDRPNESSTDTQAADIQGSSKKRKCDDFTEHRSTTPTISTIDFGPALKRKKGIEADSDSSESVGSDSSSYDITKDPLVTTTSPSRKKLVRRREHDKRHRVNNHFKHKSSSNHKSKKNKYTKRHHHKTHHLDPEYFFRKYWICAEAVNDPKLRLIATVRLTRMTPEFIKSWCQKRDPKQYGVMREQTRLSDKSRRFSSSTDDSDDLAEIRPAINSAITLMQSEDFDKSDGNRANAIFHDFPGSDKVEGIGPNSKAFQLTSDSENNSPTTPFSKAQNASTKHKRHRRSASKKTSTVFMSTEAETLMHSEDLVKSDGNLGNAIFRDFSDSNEVEVLNPISKTQQSSSDSEHNMPFTPFSKAPQTSTKPKRPPKRIKKKTSTVLISAEAETLMHSEDLKKSDGNLGNAIFHNFSDSNEVVVLNPISKTQQSTSDSEHNSPITPFAKAPRTSTKPKRPPKKVKKRTSTDFISAEAETLRHSENLKKSDGNLGNAVVHNFSDSNEVEVLNPISKTLDSTSDSEHNSPNTPFSKAPRTSTKPKRPPKKVKKRTSTDFISAEAETLRHSENLKKSDGNLGNAVVHNFSDSNEVEVLNPISKTLHSTSDSEHNSPNTPFSKAPRTSTKSKRPPKKVKKRTSTDFMSVEAETIVQSKDLEKTAGNRRSAVFYDLCDSNEVKVFNPISETQQSTSDSENNSPVQPFLNTPRASTKPKRHLRNIKEKTSSVFTSAEAIDEIIARVSRLPRQKNTEKLMDSESEEDLLLSPRKVQRISSVTVLPNELEFGNAKQPKPAFEVTKPTSPTFDSSHTGDSATREDKRSSMESKLSSTNKLIPRFIRLPCTDDDLKYFGIDTRVCVRLERLVMPFLGNKQYPNVFCHDLPNMLVECRNRVSNSKRMPANSHMKQKKLVHEFSSDSGEELPTSTAGKSPKQVIDRHKREQRTTKECDKRDNRSKHIPGQTKLKQLNDNSAKGNRFPRVKLKQKKDDSFSKRHRPAKSRIIVPSSSEDSDTNSPALSTNLIITRPATSYVDEVCRVSVNILEQTKNKVLDELCTETVENITPINTSDVLHKCTHDSGEKIKQKSKSKKPELSESVPSAKDISRKEHRATKHRSRERGAKNDDRRHDSSIRFPSASSRTHSTEERSRKESKTKDIFRKDHGALKHSSRERSSARDDRRHSRHSHYTLDSSNRNHSQTEARTKGESKSKKSRQHRRHGDPRNDVSEIHSKDTKLILANRHEEKSLTYVEKSALPKGADKELGQKHFPPKHSGGSSKEKFSEDINAESAVVAGKDGFDSSNWELERAYECLCNIDIEPVAVKHEPRHDEICEDYFLLNFSGSGFSSNEDTSSERETLEETPIQEALVECKTPKDNLEEGTHPKVSNSLASNSQPPELLGFVPRNEAVYDTSSLSDTNSDVYDPLNNIEQNDQVDYCDDSVGASSPCASKISSTYTAPSPTSTVPSPTYTAPSPTFTAPSPPDFPPSPADTAPSPVSTTHNNSSPACDHDIGLALNSKSSTAKHGGHANMRRTPSDVDMDARVNYDMSDFADKHQCKNFWSMDKMSVVANKSQKEEDEESEIEADTLSILAPSITRDSVFGGEEFEKNEPAKDISSVTAARSPGDAGQKCNEHGQTSHQQLTAIVRPTRCLPPFGDYDEASMDVDSDQGSEKEFNGKSVSALLDVLTAEIENGNMRRAVSLFNLLETKMVGSLKFKMLDSLLIKTSSGGILSPKQLGEVVKIGTAVNKVVPSFCDNLTSQVQIFRKCLKTILICKRTTSLKLLSLKLMGVTSNLGLTKLYNDILLAAINADASEVLHLYKEGQDIGIQLDFLVVRALSTMFQESKLHVLAKDVYELGCLMGVYSSIMVNDWPVCLKLRSYYTENEIEAIFNDFFSKVAMQFKGAFFLNREDLTEKEKYTIFLSIENFYESEGRNIRYLKDADSSLEAVHARISNVLQMNNIRQFITSNDCRIIEINGEAITNILSRTKLKHFPRHLSLRRPHWIPSIFDQVLRNECQSNPL